MTLIPENILPERDAALRRQAEAQRKPLEQMAADLLNAALVGVDAAVKYRDLSDLAGTWIEDPQFDAVMLEQDRIDPEMWR